ncbi:S phase cyclin A-associated protein in the endoplasmic reticulum-like [Watersipora subatra]|uniref:S phase cyclin A-associated protein in the endoplasmic reticulum-like n=1 Tax=Watersipora subatra TaxID=2589382 RepID=UPI00355C5A3B
MNSQKAYVAENPPPSDSLLMIALPDEHNELTLNLPVTESEDEDVLAMELERALGQDDEALTQQDAAIKSAIQKEQTYLLAIEETQREEMPQEYRDEELDGANSGLDSMDVSASSAGWEALVARHEAEMDRRKHLGLGWADMDDTESRTPGRGAHMHEKLSSPSRKRSVMESKKRHEERQAKAAELRERFRQEKAEKVKDLTKKVVEVRLFKDKMEEQKRDYLDRKLQEAEEKRKLQLKLKVKKAHEEETKANEIAFINSLQEQNKKMDIMTKHKDVKARLLDIQGERQRKIDEKAAKEAAVEERRKALDAERSARLAEMQLKRRRREEEIEHGKLERDKERTEALKAKEKEHKDRLAEIERQQQANIEELQKKIEQKQSDSTRRHNERLQNIREKAFIMNVLKHSTEDQPDAPKLQPYNTKKICTVCNMVIPSEVHLQSHLRGQQHQSMLQDKQTASGGWSKDQIETFNIEHLQDVPGDFVDPKQVSSRERSKSLKKRCKKLKHRMQARGNEFEAGLDLRQETVDSQHKAKLNKIVKDVNKFMQAQERGPWPQNKISALDRVLGEAVRILDKKVLKDQLAFRICGGLSTFTRLLQLLHEENVIQLYPKCCSNVCQVIRLACKSCFENCHYFLFSNRTGVIIDLLITRLTWMVDETNSKLDVIESAALGSTADSTTLANLINNNTIDITIDVVASSLVHTLAVILSCLSTSNPQSKASDKSSSSQRPGLDAFNSRISDTIRYTITVGVVDKLQSLYTNVRGYLDTNTQLFHFLQYSISFLTAISKLTVSQRQQDVFDSPKADSTELMQTYEDIELAGIMSLLYGMLLHNVPTRGEVSTPPLLSSNTLTVTLVGLRLINQLATMDLKLVQRVLGSEGVSLELRHIVSYLIWYCTQHTDNEELLHEAILCVNYFVVLNADNQAIVHSGQSPSILQQLCSLPFQYFSDPRLTLILYPCLIAACYQSDSNRNILEQELSSDLLANFLEESELQLQQKKLSPSVTRKSNSDGRMALAVRFPERLWQDAKQYFSSSS